MSIRAVISDMDGVIVNSEAEHFLSFQKMLRLDYGIDYTHHEDKEFLGTTDAHVFTILKERYPQIKEPLGQLIDRRTSLFVEIFKSRIKPLPGVYELFDYLKSKKIPMAVGTSASKKVADFTLTHLKLLPYLKTVVCAADVARGKPYPDIFLEAAKRLNIPSQDCLVLEDSAYGVQAAKAAGMNCIAIPCGPTLKQDLSQANHIVKSLTDITPKLLESFH
ncbi:MAG: HAD family phosphatase [Deltaproteobacteria bacterium]|nr:HAD family phosphatase [Deltaproteobacteria bacterium]